jgi:hypothetical protein
MTSDNFRKIKGGKTIIEENLVKAVFQGNATEIERLSELLNTPPPAIKPKLRIVKDNRKRKSVDTL